MTPLQLCENVRLNISFGFTTFLLQLCTAAVFYSLSVAITNCLTSTMTTRDRTGLFLRYREEARTLHQRPLPTDNLPHPDITDEISASSEKKEDDSTLTITRGGMEPDWIFTFNDLKGDMAELEKMLEQVAALYAQHLLPSFEDKDTSHLEHEIRVRSHRLTDMLHAVEQKVRAISKASLTLDEVNDDRKDVEHVIRRNLQKRFATPLQELSMNFRKRQKAYLDKIKQMRESYGNDNSLVSVPLHDEQMRSRAGNENNDMNEDGPQPSGAFSETQLLAVENASALAEERRRELTHVASNINDLATLVKDIAALVVDQGTVLDRIDYNLEDVRLKTTLATRELSIADRYQSKRHALCCIIILATGCGIMTLILIYKWTS